MHIHVHAIHVVWVHVTATRRVLGLPQYMKGSCDTLHKPSRKAEMEWSSRLRVGLAVKDSS
jgi:hypothetical protein